MALIKQWGDLGTGVFLGIGSAEMTFWGGGSFEQN